MKILIADTAYPDFLKTVPLGNGTYEEELQRYMLRQFGTFDAYSRNLRALGHECIDVIANHHKLQRLWTLGSQRDLARPLACQVEAFNPDIVFFQDTSIIEWLFSKPPIVAAQCSCPWPGDDKIRQCDVVFTSFPHYVKRIEALGGRAVYLPLAFEPSVIHEVVMNYHGPDAYTEFTPGPIPIIHDCVFIGGVGNPSHWKRGMETLEAVARNIPSFAWWGYGRETLPADSALHAKYKGPAWGIDMYSILAQSKIALVRHGEVSQGFANNLKLFESTGMGAMLLTEDAPNIDDFFNGTEAVTYTSASEAVFKIHYFLENSEERAWIAQNGQRRTLAEHTYEKRMRTVSDVLTSMLCPQ